MLFYLFHSYILAIFVRLEKPLKLKVFLLQFNHSLSISIAPQNGRSSKGLRYTLLDIGY